MVKKVLGVAILISLVGCGATNKLTVTESKDALGQPIKVTSYTLTDTGIYHKSIADSTESKTRLAERQAQEIREVDISAQSTDAQALLNQDKIRGIGTITITEYEGEKPTTIEDLGMKAMDALPALATSTVTGIGVVELGKTMRTALEKESVMVKGDGNTITTTKEDNDQTQVVSSAEGAATGADQDSSATPRSTTDSAVTGDEALIASCKDSNAGTTFACVNTALGEQRYSVVGNEVLKNGVFYTNVDTFESN